MCLRVVGISVPSLKQRGESVTLTCDYDLEGGKLYSVKWYRDNEEFYRYMPRLRPPQHAHKLDGVRVDVSMFSLFLKVRKMANLFAIFIYSLYLFIY